MLTPRAQEIDNKIRDIRECLPVSKEGVASGYINLTQLAAYMGSSGGGGRNKAAEVVRDLPYIGTNTKRKYAIHSVAEALYEYERRGA